MEQQTKISLDTNILIDEPDVIFDDTREFAISFTVIRELDKLKRNPDLKRAAQSAIINIWELYKRNGITILNIPNLLSESPDEKIIQDAKDNGTSIVSNDIAVRIIAKAHGVPVKELNVELAYDPDFTGYTTILGDANYEKHYVPTKEMQLVEFNEVFNVKMKENTYCIIERGVEVDGKYEYLKKDDIWYSSKGKVSRISQSRGPTSDAGMSATPLDSPQYCALHAVMQADVPLVILDGRIGTGKTLLGMMGALATTKGQRRHQHYEKVAISRPPVSVDARMKLGYLPGTLGEKLGDWIGGIMSNLKFLLNKSRDDETADKVFEEYFYMLNLDSLQGHNFHNEVFILDEFQLLNEDMLKLALSRAAEGSKIILVGDTRSQTYGINKHNEGFRRLWKELGVAEEMCYIRLENIHRSALAKFVDRIFN